MPDLRHSLVIPCYNEAGSIEALLVAAFGVLDGLGAPWEAVIVDDGSTDGTHEILQRLAAARPELRVLRLPENRGQAAALLAGLQASRGRIILTMDGDGQNDPHDLPRLLAEMQHSGADVVCGWRRDRHDTVLRQVMSRVANFISSRVMSDGLHDNGCQLRVFRREIVDTLVPSPLMQSFLPAMAVAAGYDVIEVPVRHHPRRHGQSKYGLRQLWLRPFLEMCRLRWQLQRAGDDSGDGPADPPKK